MGPRRSEGRIVPSFGPLDGIRVIDSGRFVAGPWAATYLGEFGAEVVHVEGPPFEPPFSDPTRSLPPIVPEGRSPPQGVSESWVQYSRNKLSLGLDLRTPRGRKVFLDLVRQSDIWVESSRPGTYDRLGLSDIEVHAANSRLTIVHVSGFGQTGERDRVRSPSFDLTGQAFSGYLALQGDPEPSPPMRAGTAMNDTVTGLAAAAAAIFGYVHSERTGLGQSIDVAQYEVFFTLLENLALDYFLRGVVRGRHGRSHARLYPYDVYPCRDGWVVLAAPTPRAWQTVRTLVGITEAGSDSLEWAAGHRERVDEAITALFRTRTAGELEQTGREIDLAISRVYDISDIARDPHYRQRSMFLEWDDPVAGRVKGAGIVPKFARTPGQVWRGAPWLGQDNRAILEEILGYSESAIELLERDGTLGSCRPGPTDVPDPPPFFLREAR
ncbi:MAG: CoA transferase [Thermoplasmata archaeon]|nr:CoA transferase [Thermoplasmata archaeon]MCI4359486.1 CoA transferase [Thermoplasmata archaeon]